MGQYYLHVNGSLIYKPHGGVEPSTFVRRIWNVPDFGRSPDEFVAWLKEAFEAGANKSDIERLAEASHLEKFIFCWEFTVYESEETKQ